MSHTQSKRQSLSEEESARRGLFCYFLAQLGDPREAAIQAGYPPEEAAVRAARLLDSKVILNRVARYEQMELFSTAARQAVTGLRRLAFGPVNDAVSLLVSGCVDEPPEIAGLDLFRVSEIRFRDGSWDIRFYDRLPALQALLALGPQEAAPDAPDGLRDALERGARALAENDHAL